MSTWAFNAVYIFLGDGSGFGSDIGVSGTLTDGAAGNFFDTTEQITGGTDANGSTTDSGFFIGTIDVLGVTWVAIAADSGRTLFFATVPGGTTSSQINSAFSALPGSNLSSLTLQNTGGFTTCFAAGKMIETSNGEVEVEALKIGDRVLTGEGDAVPVKWIGRQSLMKMFAGERACPVRIKAGALGDGLPHTELVLTADHALIIDGLAINAGALVNGTTITRDTMAEVPDSITFYHIETEAHDVILANGAPDETFVDYVGRKVFDNYAEYVALYDDEPVISEMPLPRISSRRQLPADLCARFGIPEFGADVAENAMAFLSKRHIA